MVEAAEATAPWFLTVSVTVKLLPGAALAGGFDTTVSTAPVTSRPSYGL